MQQICLKAQLHPLQVGAMKMPTKKDRDFSHIPLPVGTFEDDPRQVGYVSSLQNTLASFQECLLLWFLFLQFVVGEGVSFSDTKRYNWVAIFLDTSDLGTFVKQTSPVWDGTNMWKVDEWLFCKMDGPAGKNPTASTYYGCSIVIKCIFITDISQKNSNEKIPGMEHSIFDSKEFTHSITSYWSKSWHAHFLAHARIHTHYPATFCFFSKTRKGIQNKIPSTFYPAKILIDNSTLWTPSSWLVSETKGKCNRYVKSATPSSPSWINATRFFPRISHSVQPVGRPAVATWQAIAQQFL